MRTLPERERAQIPVHHQAVNNFYILPKEAIDYFKEIDNLETRYLEEKKITEGKLGKEYANIQKNKLFSF